MARVLAAALLVAAIAATPAQAAKKRYYVSLGDSYAQGWQPTGANGALTPTNKGFTDYLYRILQRQRKNRNLRLVKLGCGGATTDSMIRGTRGCFEDLPYGSTSRRTSQLTYAAKWMARRRAAGHRIAYVSISIGGNDFAHCGNRPSIGEAAACVNEGIEEIKRNLPVITRAVRKSAGRRATIAGNTYPDVLLGAWVQGNQDLARASVPVFRDNINPPMRRIYRNRRIGFVDATRDFGAYRPFDDTTTHPTYGEIPLNVASICNLGWYCENGDIHLKNAGYRRLGRLYAQLFRKLD